MKPFCLSPSVIVSCLMSSVVCGQVTAGPDGTGPFRVGHRHFDEFVQSGRTAFEAEIWYPVDETDAVGELSGYVHSDRPDKTPAVTALDSPVVSQSGPFPTIVYFHGGATPSYAADMAFLHEAFASHGFLVVATKDFKSPRAVIDNLAARNDDPESPFFGRVDTSKVGVAGLSAGGWIAASAPSSDARVKAVMLISAGAPNSRIGVPSLFLAGTNDYQLENTLDTFQNADTASKYMAVIQGVEHDSFADICGFLGQPHDCQRNNPRTIEATKQTGLAFFRSYLDDDPEQLPVLTNEYLESQELFTTLVPGILQPGDANQDYVFDQMDIVQVQAAGKYLTGEKMSRRVAWQQGDWNGGPGGVPGAPARGDRFFDQLDIVAALQSGVYLSGPYAAQNTNDTMAAGNFSEIDFVNVPEPSTIFMLIVATIGILNMRRPTCR